MLASQFDCELSYDYLRLPCPDLLVRAPTGSGKTLAFVLPILQIISQVQELLEGVLHEFLSFRSFHMISKHMLGMLT